MCAPGKLFVLWVHLSALASLAPSGRKRWRRRGQTCEGVKGTDEMGELLPDFPSSLPSSIPHPFLLPSSHLPLCSLPFPHHTLIQSQQPSLKWLRLSEPQIFSTPPPIGKGLMSRAC